MDKIKVLIADDVKIMRNLLKSTLAGLNCEVVCELGNGEKVLSAIQECKPDVVFLDINMPGRNGLDVLKDIREVDPDIFVAIVSGHSNFENVKLSIDRGANGFVVKPITMPRLQEIISKYQVGRATH